MVTTSWTVICGNMYILESISRLTSNVGSWVTIMWTEASSVSSETSSLLHRAGGVLSRSSETQQSFTSGGFESFPHSRNAVRLCIKFVFVYYAAAILGYSYLVQKWSIIDSMYFATVVFTTIGYGDLSPSNNFARLYTLCLAFFGIIILGIFLGMVGDSIVDAQNEVVEKSRQRIRRSMVLAVKNKEDTINASNSTTDTECTETREPSLWEEIIQITVKETPIVCLILLLVWLVGHVEGWDWFQSIYFAMVTGTTIGFGDLAPRKPAVRAACCFLLPLSVAVTGHVLSQIASTYMARQTRRAERSFLSRSMALADLEAMDTNRDGEVQKDEFLAYMLVALQKVDKSDINELLTLFDHLDVTKSGTITKEDIKLGREKRKIMACWEKRGNSDS